MTDFHKQVARIIEVVWMVGVNHESHTIPEIDKLLDKASDEVTALIQTLVPEEKIGWKYDSNTDVSKFYTKGNYAFTAEDWGFNVCRDIILSTIKGEKK